jgi:hypothetical protein
MSVPAPMIRCPVCVDSVTSLWGSREGHSIFECGACRLTFFDLSQLTAHDYRDYYRYTEGWRETDSSSFVTTSVSAPACRSPATSLASSSTAWAPASAAGTGSSAISARPPSKEGEDPVVMYEGKT